MNNKIKSLSIKKILKQNKQNIEIEEKKLYTIIIIIILTRRKKIF